MINPRWIGQDASQILGEIGVQADRDLRLLIADVPREHRLVWTEQMMPVLPIVRVTNVDQAIELAVRVERGFRHTASIHSTNVETITRMARAMNCSIFVANGPTSPASGKAARASPRSRSPRRPGTG